jgi:hypothetical protein
MRTGLKRNCFQIPAVSKTVFRKHFNLTRNKDELYWPSDEATSLDCPQMRSRRKVMTWSL